MFNSYLKYNFCIKNIKLGSVFTLERVITEKDVMIFGDLIQDHNRIHFDKKYGKSSIFKDNICHGMLVGSIFSSIISKNIPGSIYLKQELSFKNPVYFNDKIIGKVFIDNINNQKHINKLILSLTTQVFKNDNLLIIDGSALIKLPDYYNIIN